MDGCNVNHRDADRDDGIHTPIAFVYATEVDRIAAVSYPVGDLIKVFAANDVTKFCYVEETKKVYILVDHNPVTWEVTARADLTEVLGTSIGTIELTIANTITGPNQIQPLSVGGLSSTVVSVSSSDSDAQHALNNANILLAIGNNPNAGNFNSELVIAHILDRDSTGAGNRVEYTLTFSRPAEMGRGEVADPLAPDPSWGINGQLLRLTLHERPSYIIHNRGSETVATTTSDGLMSSGDKVVLNNTISGVDLDVVRTPSNVTVTNDAGSDAVVPSATEALAGAMSSTDKTTLNELADMTFADHTYLSSTVFSVDLDIRTSLSAVDQIRFESGNNVTELQLSLSSSEANNLQNGLGYVIVFKGLGDANYGSEEAIAITHQETSISSSDDIFDDNAYRILTIPLDRPLAKPFNNQTSQDPVSIGAVGQQVQVQFGLRRDALAYNSDSNRVGDTQRAGLLSPADSQRILRNEVQVFRQYVEYDSTDAEDLSPSDTEQVIRILDLTKDHIITAPPADFSRVLLPNDFPYMGFERTITFTIQNATNAIMRLDNTTAGVDFERLEDSTLFLKPTEARVFQVRLESGVIIYTPLGDVFYEASFFSTTLSPITNSISLVGGLNLSFESGSASPEIFSISTDSSGSFDAGDAIVPQIGGLVTFPYIGHDHSIDSLAGSAPNTIPRIVMTVRNYQRPPIQTSFKSVESSNLSTLRGTRLAFSSSSSNLFFSGYRLLSNQALRFTTQSLDTGFSKTLHKLEGTIRLNPLNIAPSI